MTRITNDAFRRIRGVWWTEEQTMPGFTEIWLRMHDALPTAPPTHVANLARDVWNANRGDMLRRYGQLMYKIGAWQ